MITAAGRLNQRAPTGGVSRRMMWWSENRLGDRACLALSLARQAAVVTGDRNWQQLMIGLEIIVFR